MGRLLLAIKQGGGGNLGKGVGRGQIVVGHQNGAIIDDRQAVEGEYSQYDGNDQYTRKGGHDLAADGKILKPVHVSCSPLRREGEAIDAASRRGFSGSRRNVSACIGGAPEAMVP